MSYHLGLLADTHHLLRPAVEAALAGCDQILHAGDVGSPDVLRRLKRIAPVVAVRGNMDRGRWSNKLPAAEMVEVAGRTFYLLHDLDQLDLDPSAAGIHVVVYGHTHRPDIKEKNGVTYLNPGSAGPRRFNKPVSVARIRIEPDALHPRIISLDG